ncbi:MAG: 2-oxoacid:acceptor oxidoreductase subunit alpha [Candidatus Melainabacteria bacterium]|nr:2-oxoacid:acceptor oxidoreductase subunit alpha [Candidatus Melainabacteria bacterium]
MSRKTDVCWMIGGPQGSGVDSSATLYARTMAVAGYWVYGKREYHSNIKGKHSYFQIRVNTEPVHSFIDPIHLLATFEKTTAQIHAHELVPGGALLYDPNTVDPDALEMESSVKRFPIPYDDLIKNMADQTGQNMVKLAITKNTISVAAAALQGVPFEAVETAILELFSGRRAKAIPINVLAARQAYECVSRLDGFEDYGFKLVEVSNKPEKGSRLLMNGAAACGVGKLKAGCRFQTYYSITPAVDECIYLEEHPEYGIVVYQAEDELAAINMTNGAVLTGARSSTATSGPGFSLMAEGIGWAGINEVPTVVFNYQRGGPSTGLPTRNEQGDLLFALHTGHGDFPKIVIAPGDMHECFEDAFYSFNYAERYQTPVIVLVDKALANSTQSIAQFDEASLRVDRGELCGPSPDFNPDDVKTGMQLYERFKITESGISPRPLLGEPGRVHWLTGDEHDPLGHITEKPEIRLQMMEKRMKKLDLASQEIPVDRQYNFYGPSQADVTIVAWGSTKGAVIDALKVLEKEHGMKVNFLQIRMMSPFPSEAVLDILRQAKTVLSIESNYSGQLAQLIRLRTGFDIQHQVLKWTGRPISETEVVAAVKEVAEKASRKVVLTCGH